MNRAAIRRVTSASMWGVIAILGVVMVGRGIWALAQPWGSTGDKVVALAFFATLAGFAAYKVFLSLAPPASGVPRDRRDNLAYAIVGLAFAMAGTFIFVHDEATPADRVAATGGIVFFGVGAVLMFLRARRG